MQQTWAVILCKTGKLDCATPVHRDAATRVLISLNFLLFGMAGACPASASKGNCGNGLSDFSGLLWKHTLLHNGKVNRRDFPDANNM